MYIQYVNKPLFLSFRFIAFYQHSQVEFSLFIRDKKTRKTKQKKNKTKKRQG